VKSLLVEVAVDLDGLVREDMRVPCRGALASGLLGSDELVGDFRFLRLWNLISTLPFTSDFG
jgi:hypothetical protein